MDTEVAIREVAEQLLCTDESMSDIDASIDSDSDTDTDSFLTPLPKRKQGNAAALNAPDVPRFKMAPQGTVYLKCNKDPNRREIRSRLFTPQEYTRETRPSVGDLRPAPLDFATYFEYPIKSPVGRALPSRFSKTPVVLTETTLRDHINVVKRLTHEEDTLMNEYFDTFRDRPYFTNNTVLKLQHKDALPEDSLVDVQLVLKGVIHYLRLLEDTENVFYIEDGPFILAMCIQYACHAVSILGAGYVQFRDFFPEFDKYALRDIAWCFEELVEYFQFETVDDPLEAWERLVHAEHEENAAFNRHEHLHAIYWKYVGGFFGRHVDLEVIMMDPERVVAAYEPKLRALLASHGLNKPVCNCEDSENQDPSRSIYLTKGIPGTGWHTSSWPWYYNVSAWTELDVPKRIYPPRNKRAKNE